MNTAAATSIRIAIPALRLLPWYRALWILAAERVLIAPPIQKLAVVPLANLIWAILAVTPFVLLRNKNIFVAYVVCFGCALGVLAWDCFVPFRYVSLGYLGEIVDSGGGFSTSGNRDDVAYWISYPTMPSATDLMVVLVVIAPLVLACAYRLFFRAWTSTPSKSWDATGGKPTG